MSRFYGTLMGQAVNAVTRRGSPRSGLYSDVNGWNSGVTIHAYADGDDDCFEVWVTGGSNNPHRRKMIGTLGPNGFAFTPQ